MTRNISEAFTLLLAPIIIITSSFTIVVILRTKSLRECASNTPSIIFAFGSVAIATGVIFRSVTTFVHPPVRPQMYHSFICLIFATPTIFGQHMSQTSILLLAIQRLICVKFPVSYRSMISKKSATLMFTSSLLFSVVGTACMYICASFDEYTSSLSASALWSPAYKIYWNGFQVVMPSFICSLYFCTIFISKLGTAQSQQTYHSLTMTLSTFLTAYVVLWFIPAMFNLGTRVVPMPTNLIHLLRSFSYQCMNFYSLISFIFLLWKHKEFRTTAITMLSLQKSTFGPMRIIPHTNAALFCFDRSS
ncbi:hypothetical protein AB6A40_004280 [Gnathostoma spinigerum]|uniref:G-protein coupled receptors family 1 profile domain-containing protein n=1 Tax=Gnathostoma spinigerum TaxID=75299 RepID=A0ABD6ED35_9BILA